MNDGIKIKFNEQGMSKELLEKLADESNYNELVYEADQYGHGKPLREYAYYPTKAPILPYIGHGPCLRDHLNQYVIDNDNSTYVYSEWMKSDYDKRSNRIARIAKAPFIMFADLYNVKKRADATGSILFPKHSNEHIKIDFDIDDLVKELDKLPQEFKPFHVMLHWHDITLGIHEKFMKLGFPVHTAGHERNNDFAFNWYEIARHFNYGVGNAYGTYINYLVHIGIPCSLIGKSPVFTNMGHKDNGADGIIEIKHKRILAFLKEFDGVHTEITDRQRDLVHVEVDCDKADSRIQMAFFLYKELIPYGFKKYIAKNILDYIPFVKRIVSLLKKGG